MESNSGDGSFMAVDQETRDKVDKLLSGTTLKGDAQLDNFLGQVDSITDILKGLASNDRKDQERALQRADILLRNDGATKCIDPENIQYEVTSNRTVINKYTEESHTEGEMSKDGFMRAVEKDAKERSENRRQRKEQSDILRKQGNKLFSKSNYAGALCNYNLAIKLIKDSPCLYNNRALTYIRLGIFSSAIEDCERAIHLEEHSLKARLFKAKSLFLMGEADACRSCLKEAENILPAHIKIIKDYENELFSMGETGKENLMELDAEKNWKKAQRYETTDK